MNSDIANAIHFVNLNLKVGRNIIVDQFFEVKKSIEQYESISDKMTALVIQSNYTKNQINKLCLMMITVILRNAICAIVCTLMSTGYKLIDLFVQLIISILFILRTDWFHYNVVKYEKEFFVVTEYFINNYNFENFRRWKKNIVTCASTFVIGYLLLTPVNSSILIEWIIQFLVCYLIIDNIENRNGIVYDAIEIIMVFTGNRIKNGRVVIFEKQPMLIVEDFHPLSHEPANNIVPDDFHPLDHQTQVKVASQLAEQSSTRQVNSLILRESDSIDDFHSLQTNERTERKQIALKESGNDDF